MGLHQRDIASLVGRTIIGIDVDEGDVEIHLDNGDEYILTGRELGEYGIGDIEGNMADLCDVPVNDARFCGLDNAFILGTVDGTVHFMIDGEALLYRVL